MSTCTTVQLLCGLIANSSKFYVHTLAHQLRRIFQRWWTTSPSLSLSLSLSHHHLQFSCTLPQLRNLLYLLVNIASIHWHENFEKEEEKEEEEEAEDDGPTFEDFEEEEDREEESLHSCQHVFAGFRVVDSSVSEGRKALVEDDLRGGMWNSRTFRAASSKPGSKSQSARYLFPCRSVNYNWTRCTDYRGELATLTQTWWWSLTWIMKIDDDDL